MNKRDHPTGPFYILRSFFIFGKTQTMYLCEMGCNKSKAAVINAAEKEKDDSQVRRHSIVVLYLLSVHVNRM